MNEQLTNLIEALREELKQYGEMLAQLDQQQSLVMQRQTNDLLISVAGVNSQTGILSATRLEREQRQRELARQLGMSENAQIAAIMPELPADYRPLIQALVQENNELLVRVQQRVRQNHLLLSHAVELMQQLINTIIPGAGPKTYDDSGRVPGKAMPQHSIYEAVG
jgi:flagellar biosynthesis/type III secretory pathway chaperone